MLLESSIEVSSAKTLLNWATGMWEVAYVQFQFSYLQPVTANHKILWFNETHKECDSFRLHIIKKNYWWEGANGTILESQRMVISNAE